MWKPSRRALILGMVSVVVVTIIGFGVYIAQPTPGHVTIVNRTSENLKTVDVQIYDRVYRLGSLAPERSAAFDFSIRGDGDYNVMIEFESGKTLNQHLGYFTHGIESTDTISVSNNDIQMTEQKIKPSLQGIFDN